MSVTEQTEPKSRGIRALYDWMMRNAKGKHAWRALAAFTFAEASFFPVPTDIMLIPMVMADRANAWKLGAWCTLWSVLGGMAGCGGGSTSSAGPGVPISAVVTLTASGSSGFFPPSTVSHTVTLAVTLQ